MQDYSIPLRRQSCSHPETSSDPVAARDHPARVVADFRHSPKLHRSWRACSRPPQTRRIGCSSHPATSAVTQHPTVDMSVGVVHSRPPYFATACPRGTKRNSPTRHLSRRRHIPPKCPLDREQTGRTASRSEPAPRDRSDQRQKVSFHPCRAARKTTTADSNLIEWAQPENEKHRPDENRSFPVMPKSARETGTQNSSRPLSTSRNTRPADCASPPASDAVSNRPRKLPRSTAGPGFQQFRWCRIVRYGCRATTRCF